MRKKSLFETNRFLNKESGKYKGSLLANVSSSTAIETGDSVQAVAKKMVDSSKEYIFPLNPKRKKWTAR